MSENYDKPFKTFDERLRILSVERNLKIEDTELAKKFLLDRSYYGLINGFKSDFVSNDVNNEIFNENTNFNDLLLQFQIDNDLKNILFKYTLLFETRFKESMAYVLSRYGVSIDEYLAPDHFTNRTGRRGKILDHIQDIENSKNDPTKYYRENKNHIPAWILFNNAMFGQMTTLYSILKPTDKESVIRCLFYITDLESNQLISEQLKLYVKEALQVIRDFRNDMAHGSRLSHFTSRSSINYPCQKYLFDTDLIDTRKTAGSGTNDLFCFISTLFILCGDYDKGMLRNELIDWQNRYESTPETKETISYYLDSTGLNVNFISELIELQNCFEFK
ncbi:Abi family protein [Latilactobacillus sakei]|uniref:Abi family protein n=1 Tax=Latilactobacillus sakei TaxID=1599 RepID=UPI003F529D86